MYLNKCALLIAFVMAITAMVGVCQADGAKEKDKVLRHAVFFKFKDGTSEKDVAKVVAAFDELSKKVDSIKDYQRGPNVSPIGFNDGYTHCFLVTFADDAGRAKYLPHPDHKAFGNVLRPHLDKVFVVDYWGTPEKERKDRELKHALFLKFKPDTSKAQIKEAEESLVKLASQCDTIKSFEWGTNNSPEKHDEGFTHCFMFTFADIDGLKKYAMMPEHQAVVQQLHEVAEDGRVLDFWTKDEAAGKRN
jgi:hypothetical protein